MPSSHSKGMKREAPGLAGGVRKRPAAAVAELSFVAFDGNAAGLDPYTVRALSDFFQKLTPRAFKKLKRNLGRKEWVSTSACTGTGMGDIAFESLLHFTKSKGRVGFGCEKVPFKREFLLKIVLPNLKGGGSACLFNELCDLPTGAGKCSQHHSNGCSPGRHVDLFMCGFPCKDLSKLNGVHDGADRARILRDGLGTSGATFHAVLGHVGLARPRVVVLENVDELQREDNGNVQFLWQAFEGLGYAGVAKALLTSDYGLPQSRKRIYLIILNCGLLGLTIAKGRDLAKTMMEQVEALAGIETQSLNNFLLNNADPRLQAEFRRRQYSCTGDAEVSTWREFHRAFFKKAGLSHEHVVAPLDVRSSEWYKLLPARERDCLGYHIYNAAMKGHNVSTFNIGQRLDRCSVGHHPVIPTITPGAKFWLRQPAASAGADYNNRLITGYEMLALQGFPMSYLARPELAEVCSDNQLADLGGNAFSFPVALAVLTGIFVHIGDAEFKDDSSEIGSADADAIARLLAEDE